MPYYYNYLYKDDLTTLLICYANNKKEAVQKLKAMFFVTLNLGESVKEVKKYLKNYDSKEYKEVFENYSRFLKTIKRIKTVGIRVQQEDVNYLEIDEAPTRFDDYSPSE